MIQFGEKIDNNILSPNFFNPKLTQPNVFQTERSRRLACLPSFCELVYIYLTKKNLNGVFPKEVGGWGGGEF